MMINKSALIIIVFLAVWIGLGAVTVRRAYKGSNDFDTYYTAGQSVLSGKSLYGGEGADLFEGKHGPFLYAPFAACFFAVFAVLPLGAAAFLWHSLLMLCLIVLVGILPSFYDSSWRRVYQSHSKIYLLLMAVVTVSMMIDNLVMAQINVLVFALIVGAIYGYLKGMDARAGFFLGLSFLLKPVSVLLFLFFLFQKKIKVVFAASLTIGVGCAVVALFTLSIPKAVSEHSLWVQRLLSPIIIKADQDIPEPHLLKPIPWSADYTQDEFKEIRKMEVSRKNRMDSLLNAKNQSLDAAMTRWLLKDRNLYADSTWYPIWTARDYRKLPVLGGGIDEQILLRALKWIPFFFVGIVSLAAFMPGANKTAESKLVILGLFLVTTILVSPYVRSHQFIVWILGMAGVLMVNATPRYVKMMMIAASIGYLLQALPYGKAAGVGTVGNLLMWTALLIWSIYGSEKGTRPQHD